jgi:hypothetical protein
MFVEIVRGHKQGSAVSSTEARGRLRHHHIDTTSVLSSAVPFQPEDDFSSVTVVNENFSPHTSWSDLPFNVHEGVLYGGRGGTVSRSNLRSPEFGVSFALGSMRSASGIASRVLASTRRSHVPKRTA